MNTEYEKALDDVITKIKEERSELFTKKDVKDIVDKLRAKKK